MHNVLLQLLHLLQGTRHAALEGQDLSCTYLACHELESVLSIVTIVITIIIIIIIIINLIAGYEYDGGIIITASHLPFNRNGFKFFTKEGGLEKGDIKVILQRAAAAAHTAGMTPHARHSDDALVLDAALNTDPSSAQHVSLFWVDS